MNPCTYADTPVDGDAVPSNEYLDRLAERGVLDRLDAYYDTIEAGEDPFPSPGKSVDEVITRARSLT